MDKIKYTPIKGSYFIFLCISQALYMTVQHRIIFMNEDKLFNIVYKTSVSWQKIQKNYIKNKNNYIYMKGVFEEVFKVT